MSKFLFLFGFGCIGLMVASALGLFRQSGVLVATEALVGMVAIIVAAVMKHAPALVLTDAQKLARKRRRHMLLALAGVGVVLAGAYVLGTSNITEWRKLIGVAMLGIAALGLLLIAGWLFFGKPAQAARGAKQGQPTAAGAQAAPHQGPAPQGQAGTKAGVGPAPGAGGGGAAPPRFPNPPANPQGILLIQRLGPLALLVAAVEAIVIVGLLSGTIGHRATKMAPAADPCRPEVREACEGAAIRSVAGSLQSEIGAELCESPPGDQRLVPCEVACKPPIGHGAEDCRRLTQHR